MPEVGKIYTIVVVDDFKHKWADLDDNGTLDISHGEAVEASIYKRAKELKIPLSQIKIERKQTLEKDVLRYPDTEATIAASPLHTFNTHSIFEEIIADIRDRKKDYFAVNFSYNTKVFYDDCDDQSGVTPSNVDKTWKNCNAFNDKMNKNLANYSSLEKMAKDWVPTYVPSGNLPNAYGLSGILAPSTITVGPDEDRQSYQINSAIDKEASPYVEYTTTSNGLDFDKDGKTDYVLDQFKSKNTEPTDLIVGRTDFLGGTSFAAPQAIINDVNADMKKKSKPKSPK